MITLTLVEVFIFLLENFSKDLFLHTKIKVKIYFNYFKVINKNNL